MIYIKVMQGDATVTAEAHDSPVYVCRQKNGIIKRCSEQKAQGILSLDGSAIYQLDGKDSLDLDDVCTAYQIYMTVYEEIIAGTSGKDTEDTDPEVPADTTEEEILTRAELTARVKDLEENNAMLMECLLEMSEAVYA